MSSRFVVSAMPKASVTCSDQLLPKSVMTLRLGLEQRLNVGVFLHGIAGFPRRAERHDGRLLQGRFLDHAEELDVSRIGARPPPFDELHAKFVQPLGDHDLVIGGKTDVLGLGAIAQASCRKFPSGRTWQAEPSRPPWLRVGEWLVTAVWPWRRG